MDYETYDVAYYDVWADGDGGWIANCMVVDRRKLMVPAGLSDRAIERHARKLYGFTGRRTVRDCDGCVTRWVDPAQAVAVEIEWGH